MLDSSADDLTDIDESEKKNLHDMLFGVSLFLNFFQLFYHLSERAMVTLLRFI